MLRDCPQARTNCGNSGKLGHIANVCWAALKKSNSVSTSQRPKSRGSMGPKSSILEKVFAMSEVEASQSKELIRGKYVVKGRLLDVLFDSSVMHSFISMECVKCLDLHVTELSCNVVVTTPTGKPVITSWVCLWYSAMVYGRDFEVNLICLPLFQMDVSLEMNWLSANHVLLDWKEKTLICGALTLEITRLLSQSAWGNTINAKAFMIMLSLEVESAVESEYIPVMREFLEVFHNNVSELPP
ncbi:uncharacterized protein LOC113850868 [Abrus precatorius]|uniref:Uncharacterized protein LOC113850868 n=1 Tax=Abrus precatorius TaxID=3816 RepID=A0A8B8K2E8_ABRPR|nr:uncharacterized protein LOC113850868 [Abrus precatorius]